MGLLSNLLKFRHVPSADDGPFLIRRAVRDDVEPALRLILAPAAGQVDSHTLDEFARMAQERRVTLDGLHVTLRENRVINAILPVISPGRTALLLCPFEAGGKAGLGAMPALVRTVCEYCQQHDVHLIQALVDPPDAKLHDALGEAGLRRMAELYYLQVSAPQSAAPPQLPPGMALVPYSSQTHDWFGRTILASYQGSLDCPALNGRRTIEDIIAGHKASGDFDPSTWVLLREGDAALGVLLLSVSIRGDAMELVYLGLATAARGRRIGELLMHHALALTAARNLPRLCLAVDAQNTPALKLYYRHGMQRIGSKIALLKDMQQNTPDAASSDKCAAGNCSTIAPQDR